MSALRTFVLATLVLAGSTVLIPRTSFAQIYPRYHSPAASSEITIAGKKIRIDYYAPSMHGLKIMGDLVPFDEVWCTGANYATQITSDANLRIHDVDLP